MRVVNDINGRSNVIGDGINVAQRVMSFAEPNQILVSRSYYEVVSRLAPDYAQLFQYVGLHRDKHVREHEVYEVHLAQPLGRASGGAGRTAGRAPAADSPIPAPAPAERAVRLDPAFIERLASALAREIGPVAKLIVQRAAERAADEGALWTRWPSTCPPRAAPAFSPVGRTCWDRRAPRPGPAGAGHRGAGSAAIAGVSRRRNRSRASDPRSSCGPSRC